MNQPINRATILDFRIRQYFSEQLLVHTMTHPLQNICHRIATCISPWQMPIEHYDSLAHGIHFLWHCLWCIYVQLASSSSPWGSCRINDVVALCHGCKIHCRVVSCRMDQIKECSISININQSILAGILTDFVVLSHSAYSGSFVYLPECPPPCALLKHSESDIIWYSDCWYKHSLQ